MKRESSDALLANPITRLLESLPALIADQMRELIQRDLEKVGMWQHYRQTISKPGADIGKTNARAMIILKKHLGVTDKFFVGTPDDQEQEIKRVANQWHKQTLFPSESTKTNSIPV